MLFRSSLVKQYVPQIGVICDVALDPFTDHGHDGILRSDGLVDNDATVEILCKQALVQAQAGCDVIAPSDMMDGRVGKIRKCLDRNGFIDVQIMSYSAKYCSAFYGPFREAIGSTTLLGRDREAGYRDKSNYQMDPFNADEAIREVMLDVEEGADSVLVKPGLPYLDVIRLVRATVNIPVFAYQVSGEYAMIKFASQHGAIDERRATLEAMAAFKRAGARGIFTYSALDVAKWLKEG